MKIIEATTEATQDPSKRYRCRHIFIDGHRCGSPSLRGEHFCYYHHMSRGFADEKAYRRTWAEFALPQLEDRSSILAAITEVLQRIACDNLPTKQAGLLLYGLQIASLNLPETGQTESPEEDNQPVEEVITNARYGDLAPIAEIVEDPNPIQISKQQDAPSPALEGETEAPLTSPQPTNPEPVILPNLNASAVTSPRISNDQMPSPHSTSRHSEPTGRHSERSEEPPYSSRSATPLSGKQPAILPNLNAGMDIAPPQTHVISTEGGAFAAAVERPLYFALVSAHPPATATNPPTPKPEINTPTQAPGVTAWYPNNCHANEKRTSRPPHPAHRYQAAQRRRSRRRHAVDGLQLA